MESQWRPIVCFKETYGENQLAAVRGMKMTISPKHMNLARVPPSEADTARDLHTATVLPNGTVLVVGGYDGTNSLASAELYDPAAGTWSATGSFRIARYYHTATLLPNGTVLVVGGNDGTNSLASAELYDSANGAWSATGNLGTVHDYHTATLLTN